MHRKKNKRRIVQNGSSMLWTTDCKNDIFHKEGEVSNNQPGKNFSLSVVGGINKLRGTSSLPAWFNGGIALTKDVSSFNSYRVSLLGGFNDELKQGGIELDHLFNLSDYIGGYRNVHTSAFIPYWV